MGLSLNKDLSVQLPIMSLKLYLLMHLMLFWHFSALQSRQHKTTHHNRREIYIRSRTVFLPLLYLMVCCSKH